MTNVLDADFNENAQAKVEEEKKANEVIEKEDAVDEEEKKK